MAHEEDGNGGRVPRYGRATAYHHKAPDRFRLACIQLPATASATKRVSVPTALWMTCPVCRPAAAIRLVKSGLDGSPPIGGVEALGFARTPLRVDYDACPGRLPTVRGCCEQLSIGAAAPSG
jgi:hypothetical protein